MRPSIKSIIKDYVYRAKPFKMLPLRLLHKLGLLRYINIDVPIKYHDRRLWVPLLGSQGIPLLRISMHEPWLRKVFGNLSVGGSGYFVDVGVNLGQTLIKSRFQFPQLSYIGFEPNPHCVAYVDRLISKNGFQQSQVLTCALSDETRCAAFFNKTLLGTQGTLPEISGIHGKDFEIKSTVLCVNAENIFDTKEINPVEIIKIDVEGGELNVVRGMREVISRDKPFIILEILSKSTNLDSTNSTQGALVKFIEGLGYSMARIRRDGGLIRVDDSAQYLNAEGLTNDYLCWADCHETSMTGSLAPK